MAHAFNRQLSPLLVRALQIAGWKMADHILPATKPTGLRTANLVFSAASVVRHAD